MAKLEMYNPIDKIKDLLECYLECYFEDEEIDNEIRWCIENSIIKRYNKYKDVFPEVSSQQDTFKNYILKSKNGMYRLEDFLLNRLFLSVRDIVMDESQSAFDGRCHMILFRKNSIRSNSESMLERLDEDLKKGTILLTLDTFLDHEIGHALKAGYKGGYKVQYDKTREAFLKVLKNYLGEENAKSFLDSKWVSELDLSYINLINRIKEKSNGKYASFVISPNELSDENAFFIGSGINTDIGSGSLAGLLLIDELLQETESMDNTGIYLMKQGKEVLSDSGNYRNIFHAISGYRNILGYGGILTALLGKKRVFQATYLHSREPLEEFNKEYYDLSREVFKNDLTPIENIGESFKKLISRIDEDEYLLLDYFFTKCYSQMIMKRIKINDSLDIDHILNEIEQFQMRLTTNDDEASRNKLSHNVVFNELKNMLCQLRSTNQQKTNLTLS